MIKRLHIITHYDIDEFNKQLGEAINESQNIGKVEVQYQYSDGTYSALLIIREKR